MKILVVSQYFWPEVFRINDICDGLIERGHSVDVLTSLPNVPQGKFYEGYGWFRRGPKSRNGVNIERVGVVERSKSIYSQAVKIYEESLQKPWNYIPARIMGYEHII